MAEAMSQVTASCDGQKYYAMNFTVIDVTGGPLGADIVTFICPRCNGQHMSSILLPEPERRCQFANDTDRPEGACH